MTLFARTTMWLRRLPAFALAAFVALSGTPAPTQETPSEIRVGIPTAYLPIAGVNLIGEPAGLLPDIWRRWSEKTGVPVTFVAASLGETLSLLRHNEIDVHASLFSNESREAWLDFTHPFHESTSGFFALRDRQDLASAQELIGKKIGVIRQSHQEGFLRFGEQRYQVRPYADAPEIMRALFAGDIDAVLHEDEAMDSLLGSAGLKGGIRRLPGEVLRNAVFSAFRKDRPQLRTLIDWGFSQISRDEYAEIERRWIDEPENRLFRPAGTIVEFNEVERAFLKEHKVIRVGMMNDWPPMSGVDTSGEPQGMSVAIAKLINERLGGVMTIVPGEWTDLIDDVKAKRLDAVFDIYVTRDRMPHFKFTFPYLEAQYAFAARAADDETYLLEKPGVRIAIEQGFATIAYVREDYPNAELIEFASSKDALDAVAAGKADAYVGNVMVIKYLLTKHEKELGALKVMGELLNRKSTLTIGVRHDWPVLRGIFNKAIMGITPAQMKAVVDPWFGGGIGDLQFTTDERFWLTEHKGAPVRVLIEDWPPFNYERNGQYTGMAVDYVRHALGALGLEAEFVRLPWSEALESIGKKEKIDLIPALSPTPERASILAFTKPFLSFPTVIFTRDDVEIISGLADLAGRRVAVEKGFLMETRLTQDHPNIQLVRFGTTEQAIEAVSTGQADAYVGNLASGTYFIQNRGLSNVKVAAPTNDTVGANAMGVRRDWPELASLLDKALVNMPVEMHTKIRGDALAVRYETGIDLREVMKYAVPAGISVLVIIGVFVFANRKLAGEVKERQRAEDGLREREGRFKALLESAPDATVIVNPKGDIVTVNRQAEVLFGVDRDKLLGSKIEVLVPDSVKDKHVSHRTGFVTASAPRGMGANLKLMARKYDGGEFPVEISLSPIQTEDGVLIAASVRDVTERRKAAQILEEKDMLLTAALENMSSGIIMVDSDLNVRVFNKKYVEMLKLPDVHVGMPLRDILLIRATRGEYGPGDVDALVEERLEGYRSHSLLTSVDHVPDGRVLESFRQLTPDGGVVSVFNDITIRTKAEDALASQSKRLQDLSTKLSRYLSPQIYEAIFAGATDAQVATSRKKLTVFFSDIKNFTSTTEEMEPEDMTFLLNDYLTKMTEIALEYGGTIDKYIGDAIMVFFGDPETKGVKEDALAAVRMAVAMQRRMHDLRAKWADMGFRLPFHIRCGINTGYCNVGNFGSDQRIDYTIIGGQVNLAARLEGICEPDGIAMSYETYSLVRDEFDADPLEPIMVKGIREPVTPYRLKDVLEDWDPDERYIRRDDVKGLRIWVDLMRMSEEQRQNAIRELEETLDILKEKKTGAADD